MNTQGLQTTLSGTGYSRDCGKNELFVLANHVKDREMKEPDAQSA